MHLGRERDIYVWIVGQDYSRSLQADFPLGDTLVLLRHGRKEDPRERNCMTLSEGCLVL